MKYTWLLAYALFGFSLPMCHADVQEGEIKDTEFLIEKQRKHSINQEPRLFFKAPIRTPKRTHKPLPTIRQLQPIPAPFSAAEYLPFHLVTQPTIASPHRSFSIGTSRSLLPYIAFFWQPIACSQGIWSTHIACTPTYYGRDTTEGKLQLKGKGKYGFARWLMEPVLHYRYSWNSHHHTKRNLHQGSIGLLLQHTDASSTQEGELAYDLLTSPNTAIMEQYCNLRYTWKKQLDTLQVQVESDNNVAYYTNLNRRLKQRIIGSITPGCIFELPQAIQLHTRLKIACHKGNEINADMKFYPMLTLTYPGTAWLQPYLGIDGMGIGSSVQPLHLAHFVTKDPFISEKFELEHYHQYLKLYGGGKGSLLSNLLYQFHITYRHLKNTPSMEATSDPTVYVPVYHRTQQKRLKMVAIIDYHIPNIGLYTTLQGSYYCFSPNVSYRYPKPIGKIKSSLAYKPSPKISLTGIVNLYKLPTLASTRKHRIAQEGAIRTELALETEYAFCKELSVCLMVGNHLHNHKFIYLTGAKQAYINVTGSIAYKW